MKTRIWNTQDIVSIVRNIAKEELLPRFSKMKAEIKGDGSLITEADLAVQNRIAAALKKIDADILFLGELSLDGSLRKVKGALPIAKK